MLRKIDALLDGGRTLVYPAAILILWCAVWAVMAGREPQAPLADLVARWTAGRMVTQGDTEQLYELTQQGQYQTGLFPNGSISWFVSPPFEAVVMAPLGWMPYPLAGLAWTAASLGALMVSLILLRDSIRVPQGTWRRLVIITFAAFPVVFLIFSGQNSAFILLWLTLTHRAIASGRPYLGGMILGLAFVKPHLVLLVPVLWILERRWTALAGLATTGVGWLAVTVLTLGPRSIEQWLHAIGGNVYVADIHQGQTFKNGGLVGLLTAVLPAGGDTLWGSLVSVASLAVGLLGVILVWRRTTGGAYRWWLVALVALVTAPHALIYDIVIAVPAIALGLARCSTAQLRVAVAVTWVALWLVPRVALSFPGAGVWTSVPWHVLPVLVLVVMLVRQAGQRTAHTDMLAQRDPSVVRT